jgi:hypothetical protein
MTITRLTTEGRPRLDVRALARADALQPGVTSIVRWTTGVAITISVPADDPDSLRLEYVVHGSGHLAQTVRERIHLERTPCTFGGERTWVVCPSCGRRCAVLYAVGSAFQCRSCHRLAYQSSRLLTYRSVQDSGLK